MNLNQENKTESIKRVFSMYSPPVFASYLSGLYCSQDVKLVIKNPRKTKLGDFKPLNNTGFYQITINNNLNKYGFLITALHEFSHLLVYKKHKNNVRPHGKEWKYIFKQLLLPILDSKKLPKDIHDSLYLSISNIKSSTCYNHELYRAIINHDKPNHLCVVEKIKNGGLFKYNGVTFVRGKIRRTRFLCVEQNTNKKFLFNGLTKVKPL